MSDNIKHKQAVNSGIIFATSTPYNPANMKLFLPVDESYKLIMDFSSMYMNLKSVFNGRILINGDDSNEILSNMPCFTKFCLIFSPMLLDFFKKQFDSFVCSYNSTHKFFKNQIWAPPPNDVLDPPDMDTSKYFFDQTLKTIQLKERKLDDAFLPNYSVRFSNASEAGSLIDPSKTVQLIKEHNMEQYDKDVTSCIKYGLAKMFESQYAPRALNPLQTILVSLMSYRCHDCADPESPTYDPECFCYLKSYALRTVFCFIQYRKGMPFRYESEHAKVFRSVFYDSIPSQFPTITTVLCELSTRSGCKATDPALEAIITKVWMSFCRNSLYGSMLGPAKKVAKILEIARLNSVVESLFWDKNACMVYKRQEFDLTKDFSRKDLSEIIKEYYLSDYFDANFKVMNDSECRWLDGSLRMMTTLPKVIPACVPLSMFESVLGTTGGRTIPFNTYYQAILSDKITVEFGYASGGDPNVDEMFANAVELIAEGNPRLHNLEQKFVEKSTNRSSGTSASESTQKYESLKASGIPDQEAKELATLTNKRLFDVVFAIKFYLVTTGMYLAQMVKERAAGIRQQVARRLRTIQMVPTIHMIKGFLVYTILDAGIKKTGLAALGKSIGDVRDALTVLRATFLGSLVSSTDVKGMDTATLLSQRRFLILACLEYLKRVDTKTFPYFMNKDPYFGITMPVELEVVDKVTGKRDKQEFSVIEFVLLSALAEVDSPTAVNEGFFTKLLNLSMFSFDSGSFETSSQHTFMLIIIMKKSIKTISEMYAPHFPRTSFICQGDDLLTYILDVFGAVSDPLMVDFINIIESNFSLMGFSIDRELHHGIGEFLKLVAVYGKHIPLHSRINVYSSETGEDFRSGTTLSRLRNFTTQLNGLSARVPNPCHTSVIGYYGALSLGYANYYVDKPGTTMIGKIADKFSLITSPIFYSKLKLEKQLLEVAKNDRTNFIVNEGDTSFGIKYILPGVWFSAPVVGLPGLSYIDSSGDVVRRGLWTSFASPAQCRYMFELIRDPDYDYNFEVSKFLEGGNSQDSGATFMNNLDPRTRTVVGALFKKFSSNWSFLTSYLSINPQTVPVPITTKFLTTKAIKYGFAQVYTFTDSSLSQLSPPKESTTVTDFLKFADTLLDPSKRSASYFAARTLRKQLPYGSVPDELLYTTRNSSRMKSTIYERSVVDNIRITTLLGIVSTAGTSHTFHSDKFLSHLSFGDYYIDKRKLVIPQGLGRFPVFKTGIGYSVPANSIQAFLINCLGFPPMNVTTATAIKDRLTRELLLIGSENAILSLISASSKAFGQKGIKLAATAVGVSEAAIEEIQTYVTNYGTAIFSMPYALSSDHIFYYNTVPTYIDKYRVTINNQLRMADNLQIAVLVSEFLNNHELLMYNLQLLPGNSFVNNF